MDINKLPFVKQYDRINTLANTTCMYIPKGAKMFACFTYVDNKPSCIFINREKKQTMNYVSFKEELCLGTLIYGTLVKNIFVCEHIYFYKNENAKTQLPLIKHILENMIRDSEYLGSISFKLPYMSNSSFILECSNLPYTTYGILQNTKMLVIQHILGGFKITKRAESEDIYELFALNATNEFEFYSTALINDFKTSHFLKTLFYKKKKSYKSIEFSDSEDEELVERDHFVGCLYIPEFKKWKPYELKQPDSIKKIQSIEKNIAL
jgi:hypothetical protein